MKPHVSPRRVGGVLLLTGITLGLHGPMSARADWEELSSAPGIVTATSDPCGAWTQVFPSGALPPGRNGAATIFDPVNDRMVVFSGNTPSISTDTYALSFAGPAWNLLLPSGAPPAARFDGGAIYDPVRQRMIVFGGSGYFGGVLNDVWALSLSGSPTWTQLLPAGTPPPARRDFEAVYDPVRDRMLVFGGHIGDNQTLFNDVWALSLSGTPTWSQLAPNGIPPSPRTAFGAIYDPVRDRMLVFGGYLGGSSRGNDTWALSLAGTPAWTQLAATGSPPSRRQLSRAVYDPVRDRMVVFGGQPGFSSNLSDLHGLSLAGTPSWRELPATTPPSPRVGKSFIYDPGRDRFAVFGGQQSGAYDNTTHVIHHDGHVVNIAIVPAPAGGSVTRNPETGCYASGTEVTLTAVGTYQYGFSHWSGDASGTMNPLTITVDGSKAVTANFVSYSFAVTFTPPSSGGVAKSPSYNDYPPGSVVTVTATPSEGWLFTHWSGDGSGTTNPMNVTVDHDDMLVRAHFVNDSVYHCMRWKTWGAPEGGAKPSDRSGYAAAYDPGRRRLWMFGGLRTAFGTLANDWWWWNLGSNTSFGWSQLAIAGTPPTGLVHASAIYDAPRDRLILFGGEDAGAVQHQEVWAVNLSGTPTWTQISAAGPGGRSRHVAVYDALRQRMVIHGGGPAGAPLDDAWALELAGTPAWIQLPAILPRTNHAAIYDTPRDRIVTFGGHGAGGTIGNVVSQLRLDEPSAWETLDPAGTLPSARFGHMAAYDPNRDQMVMYAGSTSGGVFPTEVWALKLDGYMAWHQLPVTGGAPVTTADKEGVYDTQNQTFVYNTGPESAVARLVFGGAQAVEVTVDPSGAGTVTRDPGTNCVDPGASLTLTATPAPAYQFVEWRDLGTTQNPLTFTVGDHVSLVAQFAPIGTGVAGKAAELGLDVAPNPSFGVMRIAFSLPRDGSVRLTIHDIAGREVARLADGVQVAGRHEYEWTPRTEHRRLPSGAYFLRLEFADRVMNKRLVYMR